MKRKLICILVTLCMLTALLPVSAAAFYVGADLEYDDSWAKDTRDKLKGDGIHYLVPWADFDFGLGRYVYNVNALSGKRAVMGVTGDINNIIIQAKSAGSGSAVPLINLMPDFLEWLTTNKAGFGINTQFGAFSFDAENTQKLFEFANKYYNGKGLPMQITRDGDKLTLFIPASEGSGDGTGLDLNAGLPAGSTNEGSGVQAPPSGTVQGNATMNMTQGGDDASPQSRPANFCQSSGLFWASWKLDLIPGKGISATFYLSPSDGNTAEGDEQQDGQDEGANGFPGYGQYVLMFSIVQGDGRIPESVLELILEDEEWDFSGIEDVYGPEDDLPLPGDDDLSYPGDDGFDFSEGQLGHF